MPAACEAAFTPLSRPAHQPHRRVTGPPAVKAFRKTIELHGVRVSTLTDHGLVFTARFAGDRGGRDHVESELHRLGVIQNASTTLKKHRTGQSVVPSQRGELGLR